MNSYCTKIWKVKVNVGVQALAAQAHRSDYLELA